MNLPKIIHIPASGQNYGVWRSDDEIRYMPLHWTANKNDTAVNNGKYFSRPVNPVASANAIVDDTCVVISVPANYVPYSVGGKLYKDVEVTGGGKFYKKVTNRNSYNIEMCVKYKDGKYWISEETQRNAAKFGAAIMKKYSIPISHVVRHFDVTGKYCPMPMMDQREWAKFKDLLKFYYMGGEDEMVTDEKIIVDGQELTAKAIRKDGTVYVKIRDIADAVGYKISNNGKTPVLKKT